MIDHLFTVIRRFEEADKKYARDLFMTRRMDYNLINDLPELGLIAIDFPKPIAMGFLRRVEKNVALIDSLITNANVSSEVRNLILDKLVKGLLGLAKENFIDKLLAYTVDHNTIERAKKFGFQVVPHTVISLKIPS